MIEWLRHLLGLCGEPHPSLLTLIYVSPVLGYIAYRIKEYINGKKSKKRINSKKSRRNNK